MVIEVNHGERAGYGRRTVGPGAHSPADRLGIIVGAGKEIQQINRLQQVFAGDVDLDLIAVFLLVLLHGQHAGVRIRIIIQFRGIRCDV